MAEITINFEMGASCALRLTETEMRALVTLVNHGDDAFLKVFAAQLSDRYFREHEEGFRSFFEAVRRDVFPALGLINQAREDLEKARRTRLAELREAR